MDKNHNSNSGCGVFAIIAIILLLLFSQYSSNERRDNESKAFEAQLHKNPSTWTKEEKQRYNNFVDWQSKQQN